MYPGQATTMLGLLKYPDDFSKSKGRVLSRNQIHCDKWPTELEKCVPFQKIWGPSELPIHDINGSQHLDKLKRLRNSLLNYS